MRQINKAVKNFEKKYCRRRHPSRVGIKAAGVSFMMMVIVLLVGGASDMIFDGWTFFDGVYFNFIAYSTIGFGDLFPRVEKASKLNKLGFDENGKRLLASLIMLSFMIIGLSVTSTVICSILHAIDEMSQVPATWNSRRVTTSPDNSVKLTRVQKKTDEEVRKKSMEELNGNNCLATQP